MFDGMAQGAEFAEIVRGYVERATSPLLERIAKLEASAPDFSGFVTLASFQQMSAAEASRTGAAIAEAAESLRGEIKASIAAVEAKEPQPGPPGEPGKDGEPGPQGKDGQSVTLEDIAPLVLAAVSEAVAELSPPEKGEAGKDGDPGKDGVSVVLADVEPMIREAISTAVAQIEPPKDGRDGEPGKDGRDGQPGEKGEPGANGIGLADALIDRENNLVLTLADGSTKTLGLVVGRDGKDGRDGIDGQKGDSGEPGFSLEDFEVDQKDDGRTIELRFVRGETSVVRELELPIVIDRGVYKAGAEYAKGDGCTWAGSYWIAQRVTSDKPEISDAWRLAVKRGRDGKDGRDGEKGDPGKKGDPGANGRNWT